MAIITEVAPTRMFMGKLDHGSNLLKELTSLCRDHGIQLGQVTAIGAVQQARLGFYNQQTREYQFLLIDHPLEITSLTGNVSLKDQEPMVHAHLTLADAAGKAYGGHLAEGTVVFACEVFVQILDGPRLERTFDDQTGLPLWSIP